MPCCYHRRIGDLSSEPTGKQRQAGNAKKVAYVKQPVTFLAPAASEKLVIHWTGARQLMPSVRLVVRLFMSQ